MAGVFRWTRSQDRSLHLTTPGTVPATRTWAHLGDLGRQLEAQGASPAGRGGEGPWGAGKGPWWLSQWSTWGGSAASWGSPGPCMGSRPWGLGELFRTQLEYI